MPLFVSGDAHSREVATLQAHARREVAVAMGQVGDQLAMTLWRGDRLARTVAAHTSCLCCGPAIERAVLEYATAPRGRRPPSTRLLPLMGWAR